ncbi:MAG: AfsR/SARP family transcriptional regulator [Solirubrobacteraceae bacterium]|nr:AfsR/SARP family transcriptional regulator [Solirubrobacteraceae bacterium]
MAPTARDPWRGPRASYRVRMLGEVEVEGPRGTYAPAAARPGALLAMLAIRCGQTVTADELIDALWATPGAAAHKRLHVNVLRLRRALATVEPDSDPAAFVRTRPRGYALDIDPESIDAVCFERDLSRGRAELEAGDPARASDTLRTALATFRGGALADYAYETFAQAEIQRLDELQADAFELWAEAELALGRHRSVVGELERLVTAYPLRERPRELLMVALYRCSRQSDALAAYHQARRALVDGLGIEPGRRLQGLQQAILEQSLALQAA